MCVRFRCANGGCGGCFAICVEEHGTMATQTSATGTASRTRLPISPETTSILPGAPPDRLSLDAETHNRLRSVARYATFYPQAVACSTPLQNDKRESRFVSSVGAVAGPNGIALFRVSRPQTPLVVLSHASSKKGTAGSVSSLSFQPQTTYSPLLLAAARGCGVLVWDASGHSLTPLVSRLAMDPATLSPSDRITSICWKTSSTQSLLATTNATKACLWDLRTALRANSSRPCLRLGNSRKVDTNGVVTDRLVQIAASDRDQVATLDASGIVQLFDVRMTDCSSQGNIGEFSSFSAFDHVGIGLEFLPSKGEDTRWVTWGLDLPQSGAIVKVWSDRIESEPPASDADMYWFMDGSPNNSPSPSACFPRKSIEERDYHQVVEFSTPYLACARVSPEPFNNQIVTVGMVPGKGAKDANGWHAEVWKLNDSVTNGQTIGAHYGAEKITAFRVLHDDQSASIIGTNTTLGSLRGAELALDTGRSENTCDKKDDAEMLLCCLSDNGYVTTYTVCGASSDDSGRLPDSRMSPLHAKSQPERPVTYADTSRVYFDDGKGRFAREGASLMHSFGDSVQLTSGIHTNDVLLESPVKADLQFFTAQNDDALNESLHDGTTTQFDMDVPIAYGEAAPGPAADAVELSSPSVVRPRNEDDGIEVELGIERNNLAGLINKGRIPCPRLCGGSFSPGIGGIVCFHNGEVRKMWSWYKQSHQKRRIQSPAAKGGPSSVQYSGVPDPNAYCSANGGNLSVFRSTPQQLLHSRQDCPRTLQDLEDMTDHARFSQWRSDESSEGDSSIDDQSDGSIDESASSDDKRECGRYDAQKTPPASLPRYLDKDMTDDSRSSSATTIRQKLAASGMRFNGSGPDRAFLGPTSDLVPTVYITHQHEDLVFNGQSKELARGWKLGEWDTVKEEETPISDGLNEKAFVAKKRKVSGDWIWEEVAGWPHSADHLPVEKEPQAGSSHEDNTMRQVRSDPMLDQLAPRRQERKKKYSVISDEDPVHAGAYSVRPSRIDSLVFLKKLVTHQQTMISPPDSPLLPNRMALDRGKRSASSNAVMQTPSPTSVAVVESENGLSNLTISPLGVYTLTEEPAPPGKQEREERIRDLCDHNAEVCMELSQSEKANVWSLLSQMAENVLQDEHDNFNGWGGAYGGSVGHNLVAHFLDYYQAQGDVQMLATMVCVLSGGRRNKIAEGKSFLPASHEDRYDTYIRRYADVLSGWRLMSLSAELNKHLVQRLHENDTVTVDLVVWCSACHQETTGGTSVCQQCHNYAFRCSICDIAVRGLSTVCANCGHGGHMSHMTPWFEKHSVCPTGCGCECVMTVHSGEPSSKPILDKHEMRESRLTGPIASEVCSKLT